MDEAALKRVLDALAEEGVYLSADRSEYRVKISCTKRSMGVSPALKVFFGLFKWEVYSYLILRDPPRVPTPEEDARILIEQLAKRNVRLAIDGDSVVYSPQNAVFYMREREALTAYHDDLYRILNEPVVRYERDVPDYLRRHIIRFHNSKCKYCNRRSGEDHDPDGNPWHVDHVVPLAFGGTNDTSNLTLACQRCNLLKGSKGIDQFLDQVSRQF